MFENKKILITGGTGSLGTALTKKLLKEKVSTIRIFSRDEWKQTQMESEINDERLRFLIGDIRDKERLSRALEDIDIVIHTAALKQVPVAEYNPFEAVKTNVQGAQNLIESSLDNKVDTILAISTDKAVSPLNTYGATKLLMERMFVSKNYSNQNHEITTMCVRYGNVLGSRGSVVPIFLNKISNGKKITITDFSMTRFNITMNQALNLVMRSLEQKINGSILVPKLKSYKLGDLVDAIGELVDKKLEFEIIKPRQGEKFHEVLINNHEIHNSYELNEDYIIYDKNNKFLNHNDFSNFKSTKLIDEYSSDKVTLLTKNEIKSILLDEKLIL
jgi:UDP-N-acetylglucosamine 4,6-dehydratase/UDP-glucose 4-epimerase